ncbi:MAG: DUF3486 family protein [Thauera sp.]|uniref:Uncharacterized protein n=1 Tax=Thauera phenylacetica B4P TaxID=1234382 RepID=N6Z135_9RHOO|nr:phage protein Gp27 family protein [Thauera phenylacetica]ENO97565.1 hypothetical protein C667_08178 [Thauera phenylacetica B4P]
MPRPRFFVMLPPDRQGQVDALIRRYGYVCINQVREELASIGVTVSRSALHRHAKRLQAADLQSPQRLAETVVIVLNASSDAPIAVRTSASAETVISAVGALGLPASVGRAAPT